MDDQLLDELEGRTPVDESDDNTEQYEGRDRQSSDGTSDVSSSRRTQSKPSLLSKVLFRRKEEPLSLRRAREGRPYQSMALPLRDHSVDPTDLEAMVFSGENAADEPTAIHDRWSYVNNLDEFFLRMYSTLLFTVLFATVLLGCVKWSHVMECRDAETCKPLTQYISFERLRHPEGADWLIWVFLLAMMVYWLWSVISFLPSYRDMRDMAGFFQERLGISEQEVKTLPWSEVVHAFQALVERGEFHLSVPWVVMEPASPDKRTALLAPHHIACRIMRRDNFIVALTNQGLLDFTLAGPAWSTKENQAVEDSASTGTCCAWALCPRRCCARWLGGRRGPAVLLQPFTDAGVSTANGRGKGNEEDDEDDNPYHAATFSPVGRAAAQTGAPGRVDVEMGSTASHSTAREHLEGDGEEEGWEEAASGGRSEHAGGDRETDETDADESEDDKAEEAGAPRDAGWTALLERMPVPFTTVLEWSLYLTLLNPMFSEDFRVRRGYLRDTAAIRRRMRALGTVYFFLLPFLLVFMLIYYVLLHVEEARANRDYLGPRKWSSYGRWMFREFNELPHYFERRMNASYRHADMYLKQFPSPVLAIVARAVAFIAGALLVVLVGLTLVGLDEGLLLHITFAGRNMLWYIAILSAAVTGARAVIPRPEDTVLDPKGAMRNVAAFTHYMPAHWRDRCHTYHVRGEFLQLFRFRVWLFLQELLGVLLAPWVLWSVLPAAADDLAAFLLRHTHSVDGLGDVCRFSLFDVDPENLTGGAARGHGRISRHERRAWQKQRPRQDKLEKSMLSFHAHYPHWSRAVRDHRPTPATEDSSADRGGIGGEGLSPQARSVFPHVEQWQQASLRMSGMPVADMMLPRGGTGSLMAVRQFAPTALYGAGDPLWGRTAGIGSGSPARADQRARVDRSMDRDASESRSRMGRSAGWAEPATGQEGTGRATRRCSAAGEEYRPEGNHDEEEEEERRRGIQAPPSVRIPPPRRMGHSMQVPAHSRTPRRSTDAAVAQSIALERREADLFLAFESLRESQDLTRRLRRREQALGRSRMTAREWGEFSILPPVDEMRQSAWNPPAAQTAADAEWYRGMGQGLTEMVRAGWEMGPVTGVRPGDGAPG